MCVVLMDGRTEEQTGRYWLRKEGREKHSFLALELARSAEYSYARRRAVRLRERCQTVCIQAAGWHKCAHCEVVARDLVISKRKVSGEGGIIKECPPPVPTQAPGGARQTDPFSQMYNDFGVKHIARTGVVPGCRRVDLSVRRNSRGFAVRCSD